MLWLFKPEKALKPEKVNHKPAMALVLLLALLGQPVKAARDFEWWNVRIFDGKFYIVNPATGWYEDLGWWESQSLQEVLDNNEPMLWFINGHSGMGSEAFAYPPVWDFQSSLWMAQGGAPLNTQQPARALDMQQMVDDYYQQCMSSHGDTVWQPDTGWVDLSIPQSSRPSRSDNAWNGNAWRGREPYSKPGYGGRHLTRGYGADCRRQQRRQLKEKGMPIPTDLQPVKAKFSGEIKKQMKALLLKQKQLKEASSDSELPDVKAELEDEEEGEEEEGEKEEDTGPSSSSSSSLDVDRRKPVKAATRVWQGRAKSEAPMGRGTPAKVVKVPLEPPPPRPVARKAMAKPAKAETKPSWADTKDEDTEEEHPVKDKHKKRKKDRSKKRRRRREETEEEGTEPEKAPKDPKSHEGPGGGPPPPPAGGGIAA